MEGREEDEAYYGSQEPLVKKFFQVTSRGASVALTAIGWPSGLPLADSLFSKKDQIPPRIRDCCYTEKA